MALGFAAAACTSVTCKPRHKRRVGFSRREAAARESPRADPPSAFCHPIADFPRRRKVPFGEISPPQPHGGGRKRRLKSSHLSGDSGRRQGRRPVGSPFPTPKIPPQPPRPSSELLLLRRQKRRVESIRVAGVSDLSPAETQGSSQRFAWHFPAKPSAGERHSEAGPNSSSFRWRKLLGSS